MILFHLSILPVPDRGGLFVEVEDSFRLISWVWEDLLNEMVAMARKPKLDVFGPFQSSGKC